MTHLNAAAVTDVDEVNLEFGSQLGDAVLVPITQHWQLVLRRGKGQQDMRGGREGSGLGASRGRGGCPSYSALAARSEERGRGNQKRGVRRAGETAGVEVVVPVTQLWKLVQGGAGPTPGGEEVRRRAGATAGRGGR